MMYKKAGLNKRENRRSFHMKNQKTNKDQANLARRGIKIDELEELEEDREETKKISKQDEKMRQKLKEYQKEKDRKKELESKNKKPPFRAGVYRDFGRFDPGNDSFLFYVLLHTYTLGISFKN